MQLHVGSVLKELQDILGAAQLWIDSVLSGRIGCGFRGMAEGQLRYH